MTEAVFRAPGEGRLFRRANDITMKVSSSETGGAYEVFLEECPAGFESPRHKHLEDYESFFIVEGSATCEIDGDVRDAPAGTMIHVPPGLPHQVKTRTGCKMLIIYGPGSQEGQFEELTALTPAQQQDDAVKNEIFARYNRINVPL